MKKKNRFVPAIVVMALLFLVSAAVVSAQTLDNKWFKVTVQAHAKLLNTVSGSVVDYNFGFAVYFYFSYVGPGPAPHGALYDFQIWSQDSPGHWKVLASSRSSSQFSDNFFPDWGMPLYVKNGIYLATFVTPHVSVMPNIFSAGGEIFDGTDSQGRRLFGWLTMKGELATALPFNPI